MYVDVHIIDQRISVHNKYKKIQVRGKLFLNLCDMFQSSGTMCVDIDRCTYV